MMTLWVCTKCNWLAQLKTVTVSCALHIQPRSSIKATRYNRLKHKYIHAHTSAGSIDIIRCYSYHIEMIYNVLLSNDTEWVNEWACLSVQHSTAQHSAAHHIDVYSSANRSVYVHFAVQCSWIRFLSPLFFIPIIGIYISFCLSVCLRFCLTQTHTHREFFRILV